MRTRTLLSVVAIAGLLIVAGCGGGGNNGENGVDPSAPVIESLTASPEAIWPGEDTTVTADASHPQGASLSYAWEATGGELRGTGEQITWTAPKPGGEFTISVTVSDEGGRQSSRNLTIVAGATVKGRVVDADSGEPLANAELVIDEATGTTDNDGRFTVSGVGKGTHPVGFANFDFIPVGPELTVDVDAPGADYSLPEDIPARELGDAPPPPPPF